eukprot:jgi/Orpsp1_1/1190265/evm.model.d7180000077832.1
MYDASISLIDKYFNLYETDHKSVRDMDEDEIIRRGNTILENFDLFQQLTTINNPDRGVTNSIGLFTGNIEDFIVFDEPGFKIIRNAIIHEGSVTIDDASCIGNECTATVSFDLLNVPYGTSRPGGSGSRISNYKIKGSNEYLNVVKGLIESIKENDRSIFASNDSRIRNNENINRYDNTEGAELTFISNRIIILKSNVGGQIRY